MDLADAAALGLAALAIALGLGTAGVIVFRRRDDRASATVDAGDAPASGARATGQDPGADRPPALTVSITADEDGLHRWRVTVPPAGHRTTIDVFSFRPDGDRSAPWRHELLDAPLVVGPGGSASVGGPVDPTRDYSVSIAWVSHTAEGDRRTSRFVVIAPQPA